MNSAATDMRSRGRQHRGNDCLAFLTLDEDGYIRNCTAEIQQISGYMERDLYNKHISILFPRLKYMSLLQGNELNPKLRYICHIGYAFKMFHLDHDDHYCLLTLVDLGNMNEPRRILLVVSSPDDETQTHGTDDLQTHSDPIGVVCEWQEVKEASS